MEPLTPPSLSETGPVTAPRPAPDPRYWEQLAAAPPSGAGTYRAHAGSTHPRPNDTLKRSTSRSGTDRRRQEAAAAASPSPSTHHVSPHKKRYEQLVNKIVEQASVEPLTEGNLEKFTRLEGPLISQTAVQRKAQAIEHAARKIGDGRVLPYTAMREDPQDRDAIK